MTETAPHPPIACIGAGVIGSAWALTFARAGLEVQLHDESLSVLGSATARMRTTLNDLAAGGMRIDPETVLRRIRLEPDLAAAVRGASVVQESISENLEKKRVLYRRIESLAGPTAILASSASELVPSSLFEGLACAPRALVGHPINPPYTIPVVEICCSPWTTDATRAAYHAMLLSVGQSPILVRREIRGFLVNRLQAALLGEAMHLIGEGYASVQDVDRAVSEALALRWVLLGPITTAHLNATGGITEYMSKFRESYASVIESLRVEYPWSDELIARVARQLASQTGEPGWTSTARDRSLVHLSAFKAGLLRHLSTDMPSTPAPVTE